MPNAKIQAQETGRRRRNLGPAELRDRGWHVPGTISRRGGSYVLRVYAGQSGGTKKYRWLTFRTKAEAEAMYAELLELMDRHAR